MKLKIYVNFVCDTMLNSSNNIDYIFEVESPIMPNKKFYIGGLFVSVEESVYDVVKMEAKVYGTCYYAQNKAVNSEGVIDVDKAQKIAFEAIKNISEKWHLNGTYTSRNVSCRAFKSKVTDSVE